MDGLKLEVTNQRQDEFRATGAFDPGLPADRGELVQSEQQQR
jgi:hypothetical protein